MAVRERAGAIALVTFLALATAVSRLPFTGRYLFDWDSVQFALGIQRFDLAAHRPHPPGYIGYILVGRFLMLLTHDANAALIGLSIAAESLTVALICGLAWRLFGAYAGLCSAVLLACSPLFWLYGETALTYGLEPGLSLAAFWLMYRAVARDGDGIGRAGLVVGLAGAIRPTTELFLLPLMAYVILVGPRAERNFRAARSIGMLALGTTAWVAPLLYLSGGPIAYVRQLVQLASRVSGSSAFWQAGFSGLWLNLRAVAVGLALSLGFLMPLALAVPIAVALERQMRRPSGRIEYTGRGNTASVPPRLWPMLALWTLPACGFFLLVHIGQLAYLLFVAPAALLLAGPVLNRVADAIASVRGPRAWALRAGLLAVSAAGSVAIYFAPGGAIAGVVAARDKQADQLIAEVHRWPPADTVLLADPEGTSSYRLAQYYLPEYQVVALGRDSTRAYGEMFSTRGGAPEYDLARFQRVGALVLPHSGWVLVIDAQAVNAVGDSWRLTRVDTGNGPLFAMPIDPADPARECRNAIYMRGSDCLIQPIRGPRLPPLL